MSSPKIESIKCHKILNSRSDWTIETYVQLSDGSIGIQTVPDGASRGEHEAVYVDINQAVDIVEHPINDLLVGHDPFDQKTIDGLLIDMDSTPNKSHLGGNSILSVSLAVAKACADSREIELYEYLAELYDMENWTVKFPTPVFNVINGGKHAQNELSFQEFMVIPSPDLNIVSALELGVLIYDTLRENLLRDGHETGVGDEGGFAPENFTVHKALEYIKSAASVHGIPGQNIFFGMDVAAGSFYEHTGYVIKEEKLDLTADKLSDYYAKLFKKFELIYLEDPFYERDHGAWERFTSKYSDKLMVVADDLVVTNPKFLNKAIENDLANAVIVKPNQVGTLSETFDFIRMARSAGMSIVISHRSGDTAEDTFIADLAVAVNAEFMKSGAPARGERVAKYNRLLEIFEKTQG